MFLKNNNLYRIAILSDYPPDLISYDGGVETATAGLVDGLQKYQHEFDFHVVSTSTEIEADLQIKQNGIQFHFLKLPRKFWARPRLIYRIFRTVREIHKISPDLVHCQGSIHFALAAIFSGRQRLFTIHGIRSQEAGKRIGWEGWSARLDAILEPYIYRNFNNFICISDYVQQIVGTKKQTYRVYNAVRMSFFDVHRESNPSSSRILYVGLLSPLKRPTDLIEAHRRLRESHPSLETIFCGNAESLGYLHELQSLSVEGVHFTGQLDVEDLCNELSQATVLVLPSAQENAPLVIAEAMAAGVPVVATQVGGIPEMLNYGQLGQLYKVGDIDGLVRILHTLIADPTYANSLAKIAKEVANRLFLPAEIASQTISVYRKILNTAQ